MNWCRKDKYIFIIITAYIVVSYGCLWLLNFELPQILESAIYILALPLQVMTLVLFPILDYLSLLTGEWIKVPNFFGILLILTFYNGLGWIVFHTVKIFCKKK